MNNELVIMGAGPVGVALATGMASAGRSVSIAVRDPTDPKHGALVEAHSFRRLDDDLSSARMVILAVPAPAVADVIGQLSLRPGQVVVDATNAVRSPLPAGFDTVGAYVRSLLPDGVKFVKAFNTIGAEHLTGAAFDGARAFLPLAGDDDARQEVAELATAMGFDAADLGGTDMIAMVEDHARLWIHLAFSCGWGRGFGFAAVHRDGAGR